jgi:ribosome biogenesis SPOUT family RNA methylase Rps3
MTKLIVEHLDKRLYKWCLLEYKHISQIAGKDNTIFTNFKSIKDADKLRDYGTVYKEPVKELKFENACILDPGAKETLKPDEIFDYLILGGILGDFPPRKRTKKELTDRLGFPARNLGKGQMSTNTAAYVAWKIVNGTPIEKIKFQRKLVIKVSECEEIILPYRFVVEHGKVFLPDGYIEMAKHSQ